MPLAPDIWKMLAGIAIFLLGMNFLEDGLRQLAGRPFKLFLKKHTSSKLKAILGGAIVTAVLQSSSIVNLMVLAFTGAGVIKMQNALAVILGANLGTTISSWIIATVGFQFNIESFALPIVAIAGVVMIIVNKESRWFHWCKFLFGFGFLFLGLGFIRAGMEELVQQFDLSILEKQPAIVFVVAGLAITSLIQSSSATVAIVLSALHVEAISLFAAMAIVLGSEIGTTLKLIIASVKGLAVKKRVALGNLLFNSIVVVIILILLKPINGFISNTIGFNDNLLALVFFQTLINLSGIILFYPFLEMFGKFLERRFVDSDNETLFIHKVKVGDTELAVAALEKETQHLIYHVAGLAFAAFEKKQTPVPQLQFSKGFESKTLLEKYEYVKQIHGEVQQFSFQLQRSDISKEISFRIGQLITSFRNAMYAAKNIKDALPDIDQLKKSSNDLKYDFYRRTSDHVAGFFDNINEILASGNAESYFEKLRTIYTSAQADYKNTMEEIYQKGMLETLTEIEFSTVVNFNREIFTLEKSIVFSLKDYLLTEEQANYFDELPGFIR
jgi:phosphate:Na+ symporter